MCMNDESRLPTSPSITSTCQGAEGVERAVGVFEARGSRPTRLEPLVHFSLLVTHSTNICLLD